MRGLRRNEFDPYQFSIKKIGSRDKLASPLCPSHGILFTFLSPLHARNFAQSGLSRFYFGFQQRSMGRVTLRALP